MKQAAVPTHHAISPWPCHPFAFMLNHTNHTHQDRNKLLLGFQQTRITWNEGINRAGFNASVRLIVVDVLRGRFLLSRRLAATPNAQVRTLRRGQDHHTPYPTRRARKRTYSGMHRRRDSPQHELKRVESVATPHGHHDLCS